MSSEAVRDALGVSTELAARIKDELDAWHRREGGTASRAATELARLASAVAERMGQRAQALRLQLAADELSLDDLASINERARLVEELHAVLDNSSYKTLHPVLRPTVEYELSRLGISAVVLVCGTRDTLYEIEDISLEDTDPLVSPTHKPAASAPLLVFRVPNVPLDWPLHHVLLYHEVGHALIRPRLHELPTPPLPADYNPNSVEDAAEKAKRFQKLSMYTTAAQAWFEELYADAVGALLAGPAYLFAFCRFLGSFSSLELAFKSHPPTGLRIRLIKDILDATGLIDEAGTVARARADAWVSHEPSTFKSEELRPDVGDELLKAATAAHPEILKLARQHVGDLTMARERVKLNRERGKLLRENGIPPIEDAQGGPLCPADVFGSVWAAFLDDTDGDNGGKPPHRSEHYARVLLGALDGVEAMRVWAES